MQPAILILDSCRAFRFFAVTQNLIHQLKQLIIQKTHIADFNAKTKTRQIFGSPGLALQTFALDRRCQNPTHSHDCNWLQPEWKETTKTCRPIGLMFNTPFWDESKQIQSQHTDRSHGILQFLFTQIWLSKWLHRDLHTAGTRGPFWKHELGQNHSYCKTLCSLTSSLMISLVMMEIFNHLHLTVVEKNMVLKLSVHTYLAYLDV